MSINFDKINNWQQTTNETTGNQGDLLQTSTEQIFDNGYLSQAKQEYNAKLAELQPWKKRNIYTEVKDEGQDSISLCCEIQSHI